MSFGMRRMCWKFIRMMLNSADFARATGSRSPAAKDRFSCARCLTERVQPGVVYTTFHHPDTGANVVTTENSDWATNCPEYKVTAVQVKPTTRRPERIPPARIVHDAMATKP